MVLITPEAKPRPSKVYLKIFLIVLILSSMTVAITLSLLNSEKFTLFAADYLAGIVSANAAKLEFEGVSGSLKHGVFIKKLVWRKASPYQIVSCEDIRLRFDFSNLLAVKKIMAEIDCKKIETGGQAMPVWLEQLPNFPEIACLANLPGNLFFARVKVDELLIKPFNEGLIQIRLAGLLLGKPDQHEVQKVSCLAGGFFRDRRFLEGSFSGKLQQKSQKFEGRIEACVAGKKLISEIAVANRKGNLEFSGHIVEAAVDLAVISRWLISMWQDAFPFGFDGEISIGGSWIFNPKTGFLGNLSGNFQKLHMVAQGLFLTIFELNGTWKLFDGNLEFADGGSFFAGFPAVFDGRIEGVFNANRRWNLSFKADHIDMGQFYSDLPWGVKYGSGLPQMTGTATFNLHIRGAYPDVAAAIKADEIEVANQNARHRLKGAINFTFNEKEKLKWQLDLKNLFIAGLPAMFQRFSSASADGGSLEKISGWSGCSWKGSGENLGNMKIQGQLLASEQHPVQLSGQFSDSNGRFSASVPEKSPFNSTKLSFLQFLLSY